MYVPVAFAQACGPCQISAGGQCVTCPNDSDLPECEDCVDGKLVDEPQNWIQRYEVIPAVIVALATAGAVSLMNYYVLKEKA